MLVAGGASRVRRHQESMSAPPARKILLLSGKVLDLGEGQNPVVTS